MTLNEPHVPSLVGNGGHGAATNVNDAAANRVGVVITTNTVKGCNYAYYTDS